jgi:DNA-binding NtrC family response regulator
LRVRVSRVINYPVMATLDTGNPARAVIVDDKLALAENIAEILILEGLPSEVFGSAEEALPTALGEGVAIVVTDYRLPGIRGADFVMRIRAQRKHLRAVVISAYSDQMTMKAASEAGAHFLPKPVDYVWLSKFVREIG